MSSNDPPKPPTVSGPAPVAAPATGGATKSKAKTATKATGAGTQAKTKKPARKKKATSKSSSAASAQALLNSARAAQLDLAKQKAQAAARRADPLWYRIEDVMPVVKDASFMSGVVGILPEQAQIVEAALEKNGLSRADVTPQAMACLLEQSRRIGHELVVNAQDYAYSANRAEINKADLLLAVEMKSDHKLSISTQLPKLNLIAQQTNRAPLPPIPSQCYTGVLLPPKQHQLTACTYDIVSGSRLTEQKMVQKLPEAPSKQQQQKPTTPPPSYGATRASKPIQVNLKKAIGEGPTPMDISPSVAAPAMDTAASQGAAPAPPPPAAPSDSSGPSRPPEPSGSAPTSTS